MPARFDFTAHAVYPPRPRAEIQGPSGVDATFDWQAALATSPAWMATAVLTNSVAGYPFFPELTDIWADSANWTLGHWLTGRLGAVSLAALVRTLCLRAGFPANRIDVSGLHGAVEGYVIAALESPRNSIAVLARHFGFDAVESDGNIRFVARGRAAVVSLTPDQLVAVTDVATNLSSIPPPEPNHSFFWSS